MNHTPVYWLALVALFTQYATRNSYFAARFTFHVSRFTFHLSRFIFHPELKWIIFITLPYFILVAQYRYWWGEWCPPARYLTPILPLLVGPLALAVARFQTARFTAVFMALTLWGWGVSMLFAVNGKLMYNHPLGQSALLVALSNLSGVDLTRFEPSFIMLFLTNFDPVRWAVTQTALTIAWLLALSSLALVAFGWNRPARHKALTRTDKLPIIRATSVPEE